MKMCKRACVSLQTTEEQYRAWANVIGLRRQESELTAIVKDLHELLRDVYAERGQRRLDRLSIVVSVVGIAGICNDVFANSFGEFMEDEGYWTTLVWVPAGMTILFAILGLLLAYWLKFRM